MGMTVAYSGHDGIKRQIEAIRGRMLELGAAYGLNDPKVLQASRELDALIVDYHKSKQKTLECCGFCLYTGISSE